MREELDELRRMAIFAAVVDAQSFSEAARRLGMAKSAVSKQVSELELALGVRLMNRTTRRLALTEAGERFYGSCSRILAEAVEATQAVRDLQEQPKGTLRLTTSISFGARFVVPHVAEFAESYPEVRFELELTDRYVDLIESNIDLAVRVGSLEDSSLIARKLAPVEMHVVASASMLEAHGTPQTPGDLGTWPAIRYSMRNASPVLCRDGEEHRLRLAPGTMASNNGSAILEFARRGRSRASCPGTRCSPATRCTPYIRRRIAFRRRCGSS